MGQRSQQFIKVHNPLYTLTQRYKKYGKKELAKLLALPDYEKWKKALGLEPFTVLAYHHQWLYGLTFPSLVHQVLDFYHGAPVGHCDEHPLNSPDDFLDHALRQDYDTELSSIGHFVDFHTFLIGINARPWRYTRSRSVEGFRFLNIEEPEMREAFDRGDNNDGVCIIDAVEGKYAFMSINEYDGKGYLGDMNPFECYKPLSAVQYVEAYYPVKDEGRYGYGEKDFKPLTKKAIRANATRIKTAEKNFAKFAVLTVEEIQKIFPNWKRV